VRPLALAVVLAAVLVAATAPAATPPPPTVGKPAPAFTLSMMDGRSAKLAELRGRVVVLNFWHSG
jgi:hypothetical protein